jgi:uncharacterized protein YndB with AHSA1/START domain
MPAKKDKPVKVVGREFVIIREFAAPRELVFQACTDARHLAQWWGPRGFTAPVCEWDARPGNKIYVVMRAPDGTRYPMGGEFREVVPPERLVTVTGALDEDGQLMFEILHVMTLAEHEGKTKLTMHSRVIKAKPGAERYIGGFEAGMTQSLERLGGILKHLGGPLVVQRVFNAPAAQLWKALTDAAELRRWYLDVKEFKPEKGFEFEFTVKYKGGTFRHLCKITKVVPGQLIAYTWRYAGHKGDSLVTFELFPEGKQTRLKLTHEGLETFPKIASFASQNFLMGWTQIIGSLLKSYLKKAARKPAKSKTRKKEK